MGKIEIYRNKEKVSDKILEPIIAVLPYIVSDALNVSTSSATAQRFIVVVNDQKDIESHIQPLEILVFSDHFSSSILEHESRLGVIKCELQKIVPRDMMTTLSIFIGQIIGCELRNMKP